jgi:hypothetical protein
MVGKLGGWPDPFWDGDHLGGKLACGQHTKEESPSRPE